MIRKTFILLAILLLGCGFLNSDVVTNRVLSAENINNSSLKETRSISTTGVDISFYDRHTIPRELKQLNEDKERIVAPNPIFKGQVEVIQIVDNNGIVLASKVVK